MLLAGFSHRVKIENRDPKLPAPQLYFMYDEADFPGYCNESVVLLPENAASPLLPSAYFFI